MWEYWISSWRYWKQIYSIFTGIEVLQYTKNSKINLQVPVPTQKHSDWRTCAVSRLCNWCRVAQSYSTQNSRSRRYRAPREIASYPGLDSCNCWCDWWARRKCVSKAPSPLRACSLVPPALSTGSLLYYREHLSAVSALPWWDPPLEDPIKVPPCRLCSCPPSTTRIFRRRCLRSLNFQATRWPIIPGRCLRTFPAQPTWYEEEAINYLIIIAVNFFRREQ